ncbi:MAG: ribonuclease HII [Bacteroidia bacterium]|nr:ribonuclease HII [Bacteroidia bacterium]MCZ2277169.1 ribonuclease HII [Bacteroidia bacterium]
MLLSSFTDFIEAGCDEAGRGALAGPVYAAAVILPAGFKHPLLNDSKQLTEKTRYKLREIIQAEAAAWAVASCSPAEIDEINILQASLKAMHRALSELKTIPEVILVDGNHFKSWNNTPHHCIVKGDAKVYSIAAASVLAKTFRDDLMTELHKQFPVYGWNKNKGYPTYLHLQAIREHGLTPLHRKSFQCKRQLRLAF